MATPMASMHEANAELERREGLRPRMFGYYEVLVAAAIRPLSDGPTQRPCLAGGSRLSSLACNGLCRTSA